MNKEKTIRILKTMLIDVRFHFKRHRSYLKLGARGKDELSRIYEDEEEALNNAIKFLEGEKQ